MPDSRQRFFSVQRMHSTLQRQPTPVSGTFILTTHTFWSWLRTSGLKGKTQSACRFERLPNPLVPIQVRARAPVSRYVFAERIFVTGEAFCGTHTIRT